MLSSYFDIRDWFYIIMTKIDTLKNMDTTYIKYYRSSQCNITKSYILTVILL